VLLAPPAPDAMRRVPWVAYLPVPLLERLRPKLSAGFRALAWGPGAPREMVDEETAVSDRNSLYVFKATWRQWLQLDAHALGRVRLPVQVLAGDADRLTPPEGARRLASALAQAELELLPGCGHQILLERPLRVLDAVLAAARA
jgi:abhydrolase domain-containing protein 8